MVLRYFAEAVGILLIAGYLFYDSVWVGLLFFPYVIYYIKRGLKNWERKRQEKISVEFKDGMQAVVSALTAGYSIENSFREAIGELELLYGKKTIIYEGFARIIFRLNLNTNVEEAFAEFAKECKVEEITSFSEILSYKALGVGLSVDQQTLDDLAVLHISIEADSFLFVLHEHVCENEDRGEYADDSAEYQKRI